MEEFLLFTSQLCHEFSLYYGQYENIIYPIDLSISAELGHVIDNSLLIAESIMKYGGRT